MPAWLALSVGAVTLLVIAGHVLAVNLSAMPARRRRIRLTAGILMMLVTPLLAYGLGIATPSRPRMYVLVWVLVAALLFMIILLALLDVMNTLRMHREQLRALRERIALARADAAERTREKVAKGPAGRRDG